MVHTTLCFIFNQEMQCLMMQRTREPHKGQWNAPGGKLLIGEDPRQACLREVLEETGLSLKNIDSLGSIDCIDALATDNAWRLHLFTSRHAKVTVPGSEEGKFAWLDLETVLAGGSNIVHNIPLILPLLLRGVSIRGVFEYRDDFLERYNISLTNRGRGLKI